MACYPQSLPPLLQQLPPCQQQMVAVGMQWMLSLAWTMSAVTTPPMLAKGMGTGMGMGMDMVVVGMLPEGITI